MADTAKRIGQPPFYRFVETGVVLRITTTSPRDSAHLALGQEDPNRCPVRVRIVGITTASFPAIPDPHDPLPGECSIAMELRTTDEDRSLAGRTGVSGE